MPKLNERGVVHIFLIIVLLLGIIASVYLVLEGPKIFKPRASEIKPASPEVSFTLQKGTTSDCNNVFCKYFPVDPSSGDEPLVVDLYARSDFETANLFSAKLSFPAGLLEVVAIKTEGTAFDPEKVSLDEKALWCSYDSECPSDHYCPAPKDKPLPSSLTDRNELINYICRPKEEGQATFVKNWVEQNFDNNEGTISLVGGVPDPGIQTKTGEDSSIMATIIFRVKKAQGQAKVKFEETSGIYSNATNTNILVTKRDLDVKLAEEKLCPQVVTSAQNPAGKECKEFATPCDVPAGWEKIESCPKTSCPLPLICSTGQQLITGDPAPGSPDQCPGYTCVTPPPPKKSGDGNKDGKIDLTDMSVLLSKFNKDDKSEADLNGDGKINSFDFSMMINLLIENKVIKGKR